MSFDASLKPHEIDAIVARYYANKITSCKNRKISFELTFAEVKSLMKRKRCAYTGILMTKSKGSEQIATDFTIDRIDNSKGYVKGNVVACCYAANSFKGTVENITDTLSLRDKGKILLMAAEMIDKMNSTAK